MPIRKPKHLLVPVDLSETSRAGLRAAGDLAERFGAYLTVLLVEPATAGMTQVMAGGVAFIPESKEAAARHLENVRQRVVEFARTTLGEEHEANVLAVEGLFVADTIVAFAKEREADWICLGAGGKTGWQRFFLGSTAAEVLRRSPVPVLTLRGRTEDATEFVFDDFRRVLLAVDLGEESRALLEYAALLAGSTGRITPLHVIEIPADYGVAIGDVPFYGAPLAIPAENVNAAKEWTEGAMQQLTEAVDARLLEPFRVETGRPADRILAVEHELEPDVTVIGTHGRHGLERILLGSVAERVARSAGGPVLVVPTRPE